MNSQKIAIIDYKVGNVFSVSNAIKTLNYKNIWVTNNEQKILQADFLVLPGVGAFEACMNNLKELNLLPVLNEAVLVKSKPILGICVGMQLMSTIGEENGIHAGLNWIEGKVKKLQLPNQFAVPHVGWNDIEIKNTAPLYTKNLESSNFYFDHSYAFNCHQKYVSAYCNYGVKLVASIQKNNITGVQFHPEKSQTSGLKLFRSFFNQ